MASVPAWAFVWHPRRSLSPPPAKAIPAVLFDRVIFWGKMGLASCTPSACKLRGKSSDRLGQIRGVERNLNQLPRQRHWRNAAKAASGRRLAKYKKEMAANAKAIAAGKAKSKAIANAMKAANAKLAKDQAAINGKYKATMKALAATNAKNQKAMNAAAEKSQKSFAAKFAGNFNAATKFQREMFDDRESQTSTTKFTGTRLIDAVESLEDS